ncbi:hypothetical protein pb186bvf_004733 [Paramecium bursaria]
MLRQNSFQLPQCVKYIQLKKYQQGYIIGQYVLGEKIGEGGFEQAKVYKASIGTQQFAVKIIDININNDPMLVKQFNIEIQLLNDLKHPNIVNIMDIYCDRDKMELYLIMELCEHGDLRSIMDKKIIGDRAAIEITSQIMNGLLCLLNQGYIHRDIKPENILIKNKIFKLADFGLAGKIPDKNYFQAQVGTPIYMAPQILQRSPYTLKSDIWSLGLVFYEMVFGRTPWLCRSFETYLSSIIDEPLRFPYEIQVSPDIKDFIKGCLQIEEESRFSWDQVKNHQIFKQNVKPAQQVNFSKEEILILSNMQTILKEKNLEAKTLMQNSRVKYLTKETFYHFLLHFQKDIPQQISNQIFFKFDKNNDGKIESQEFHDFFNEHDFQPVGSFVDQILKELRAIINKYNIPITELFKKFDKDQNGIIDYKEFFGLIKIIAPAVKTKEIKIIFNLFDQDQNGVVSFKEFQFALRSSNFYKHSKILSRITQCLKQKKVDPIVLFKYLDKDQKGYLNFSEFHKLMSKVDDVNENESKELFLLFDQDGNQRINLNEFIQIIY